MARGDGRTGIPTSFPPPLVAAEKTRPRTVGATTSLAPVGQSAGGRPPGFTAAEWDDALETGQAREVALPPAPPQYLPRWASSSIRFLCLTVQALRRRWR